MHDLAPDDAVVAVVATDSLRHPMVAVKTMADDSARCAVDEAQFVHDSATLRSQRMEHSA
ncbi:DUF6192 family protein [Streptomyces sp. NPDC050619]|uniref:DUF6192 family protein n=1 Tax=Streptomyces sp. NPDC050619 TaxID=3157214 RepID=UPI00343839AD